MTTEFGVLIPTRKSVMSGRMETSPLLSMAERAEAAGPRRSLAKGWAPA